LIQLQNAPNYGERIVHPLFRYQHRDAFLFVLDLRASQFRTHRLQVEQNVLH